METFKKLNKTKEDFKNKNYKTVLETILNITNIDFLDIEYNENVWSFTCGSSKINIGIIEENSLWYLNTGVININPDIENKLEIYKEILRSNLTENKFSTFYFNDNAVYLSFFNFLYYTNIEQIIDVLCNISHKSDYYDNQFVKKYGVKFFDKMLGESQEKKWNVKDSEINYSNKIEQYFRLGEILLEHGYKKESEIVLTNILYTGIYYEYLSNNKRGIEFFLSSLKLLNYIDNRMDKIKFLNNCFNYIKQNITDLKITNNMPAIIVYDYLSPPDNLLINSSNYIDNILNRYNVLKNDYIFDKNQLFLFLESNIFRCFFNNSPGKKKCQEIIGRIDELKNKIENEKLYEYYKEIFYTDGLIKFQIDLFIAKSLEIFGINSEEYRTDKREWNLNYNEYSIKITYYYDELLNEILLFYIDLGTLLNPGDVLKVEYLLTLNNSYTGIFKFGLHNDNIILSYSMPVKYLNEQMTAEIMKNILDTGQYYKNYLAENKYISD